MTPLVTLIPVPPAGAQYARAIARRDDDTCFLYAYDEPVPPEHARLDGAMLRRMRSGSDVSMGDLARALGLRTPDVSRLERGAATLSAEDWLTVFREIAKLAENPPPVEWAEPEPPRGEFDAPNEAT